MQGKVILVTGANGGLGTAVTEALLATGATVAGVSRDIKPADFSHANFAAFPADLSNSQAATALVNAVVQRFRRLDALVHLVGGFAGGKSVHETDDASFEKMMAMNLAAAFYMAKAVLPHMRKAGGGRIVAIGSRAALEPAAGVAAYSASKAALVSLIKTIAIENKDVGITANVLLPTTIDTAANRAAMPKADSSTWVQPQSLASFIVWLLGDAGGAVNGAAIPVYGRDV